ncbi:hypothetical protein H9Q09_12090 [Aurantimonas sp. DM33-3]|uniref:hypothetical protein n=1 Tax=Aurantimonas sp. DM33-3 TaxID=2766955 RepID=UPI0016529965|nr:hypothetical protein [Aurantimonas sp. DM33-3]MBC6716949.1 hypothetical protein [Aurantimonas sp. DM33-3]
MADIHPILIRSHAHDYGASVVAGGAKLVDPDGVVVGRILRCSRRGTDPDYGWQADAVAADDSTLPDRIDEPHARSSYGSLYSVQVGPIRKAAYSPAVERRAGRAPKPELPPETPVPVELHPIRDRLLDLMAIYFAASSYGNAPPIEPPLVRYRRTGTEGVICETLPHPRRRTRGSYALRYVLVCDLGKVAAAWELTSGIAAIDDIVVCHAELVGHIDGGEVYRVEGVRNGVMDDRRKRLVIRALDGTPVAARTMTGLKTAVRRYNKNVHADWSTVEIAAQVANRDFEITTPGIAVTNARFSLPDGILTLVGVIGRGRDEACYRQASDGRWVRGRYRLSDYDAWLAAKAEAALPADQEIDEEDLEAIGLLR